MDLVPDSRDPSGYGGLLVDADLYLSSRRRVPWAISLTRSPRAPIGDARHRREGVSSFQARLGSAKLCRCAKRRHDGGVVQLVKHLVVVRILSRVRVPSATPMPGFGVRAFTVLICLYHPELIGSKGSDAQRNRLVATMPPPSCRSTFVSRARARSTSMSPTRAFATLTSIPPAAVGSRRLPACAGREFVGTSPRLAPA